MRLELKTISIKRFLLLVLPSIPVALALSIGIALLFSMKWLVLLVVPLLALAFYLGQRYAQTNTLVALGDGETFRINDREIAYRDVVGYFLNDPGLTQIALCLRLNTNETIQITGNSVGEQGKLFRDMQAHVIEILRTKKPDLAVLKYQDVYTRQANILRPVVIYVLIPVVILINGVLIYLIVTENRDIPWQIFLINGVLIRLIPYAKKEKNNRT